MRDCTGKHFSVCHSHSHSHSHSHNFCQRVFHSCRDQPCDPVTSSDRDCLGNYIQHPFAFLKPECHCGVHVGDKAHFSSDSDNNSVGHWDCYVLSDCDCLEFREPCSARVPHRKQFGEHQPPAHILT